MNLLSEVTTESPLIQNQIKFLIFYIFFSTLYKNQISLLEYIKPIFIYLVHQPMFKCLLSKSYFTTSILINFTIKIYFTFFPTFTQALFYFKKYCRVTKPAHKVIMIIPLLEIELKTFSISNNNSISKKKKLLQRKL